MKIKANKGQTDMDCFKNYSNSTVAQDAFSVSSVNEIKEFLSFKSNNCSDCKKVWTENWKIFVRKFQDK